MAGWDIDLGAEWECTWSHACFSNIFSKSMDGRMEVGTVRPIFLDKSIVVGTVQPIWDSESGVPLIWPLNGPRSGGDTCPVCLRISIDGQYMHDFNWGHGSEWRPLFGQPQICLWYFLTFLPSIIRFERWDVLKIHWSVEPTASAIILSDLYCPLWFIRGMEASGSHPLTGPRCPTYGDAVAGWDCKTWVMSGVMTWEYVWVFLDKSMVGTVRHICPSGWDSTTHVKSGFMWIARVPTLPCPKPWLGFEGFEEVVDDIQYK